MECVHIHMYVWYVRNLNGIKIRYSFIYMLYDILRNILCIKVDRITSWGHAYMIKHDAAVYNTFPFLDF